MFINEAVCLSTINFLNLFGFDNRVPCRVSTRIISYSRFPMRTRGYALLTPPLLTKRYDPGQQYQPHHDFSDAGVVHQRFLTLLLYISPAQEGGATSFPKAHSGRGLRVRPPKGSGVLFYSMLPDGNGDDLSLHAGEPVTVGRKWVCNLWVWDPKRGSGRL